MPFSRIAKSLTLSGEIVAKSLRTLTSKGGKGGYPSEIKDSIEVGTVQQSGEVSFIDIFATGLGGLLARVYELGSGLTGPKGRRYPITPKNASVLHFMWPEALNINPGRPPGTVAQPVVDESGEAFLPKVMHPGVRPRPFIDTAIDMSSDEVLELLGQDALVEITNMLGPPREVIE